MKKPFKFRYVNEIVGGFILLVIAALLTGVILAGLAQQWFEPKLELRIRFPPEGSAGIKKGAEVVIMGTLVGTVDRVIVEDDGSMEGVLSIQQEFARFIRDDSRAVLKKKFGVAGDAFVEITKGDGSVLQDAMLPTAAEIDADLVVALQALLEQVHKAVEEYGGLAADLRQPGGHAQQTLLQTQDTLREAEVLIEGVQRHWLLKKYIEDDALPERIAPLDLTVREGDAL